MTAEKLWKSTVLLPVACLITGRFAIFTNGGNGNIVWYLLFWLFGTGLFFTSGLLLAKTFQLQNRFTFVLVVFLTLFGFVGSSPIGLMTLIGLPVLLPFAVFVIVLLLIIKAVKAKEPDRQK